MDRVCGGGGTFSSREILTEGFKSRPGYAIKINYVIPLSKVNVHLRPAHSPAPIYTIFRKPMKGFEISLI